MSDQNTEVVEKIDETAAADTLKPSPSKAEMLATFTSLMAQLGKEDLSKFLNDALAQIGKEAEKTPSATAPGQTGLGQMPMPKLVAKEDVEEMFAGETLTEEFKEKTVTIFEAAVNARLTIEKARLEEETEKKIEEAVALFQDDLSSKVDQYMDYVVETWVKENEIALVESLRSEIAEEFIGGLHKLFTESYINIPEEKVDVLGELSARIEEIQAKLDEEINKNIELQNVINEAEKQTTFDEVAEGLVATQVEKFRTLSEGVDFADVDAYRKKLQVIKEQYFAKKEKPATNIVTEETEAVEPVAAPVPAHMAKYVSAISRTLK
jgi:hypothetical protein